MQGQDCVAESLHNLQPVIRARPAGRAPADFQGACYFSGCGRGGGKLRYDARRQRHHSNRGGGVGGL